MDHPQGEAAEPSQPTPQPHVALADAAARLGTTPKDLVQLLMSGQWSDSIFVAQTAVDRLAVIYKPSGGGGVVNK